ncbi:glutathione S-transferase [Tanacetum coccineum]
MSDRSGSLVGQGSTCNRVCGREYPSAVRVCPRSYKECGARDVPECGLKLIGKSKENQSGEENEERGLYDERKVVLFDKDNLLLLDVVYGSMVSTPTLRVLLSIIEKDLDFELISIELAAGEQKKPHIMSRNPFGQIPAIEDGDITLFESRAITRYIAQTYADKGTVLINKDPKKAAMESVWMEVESQRFEPATVKIVWELCMKRFLFGWEGDHAIVKELQKVLEGILDVYEARLKESKYLGGDEYSLADLNHVPVFKFLMDTEMKKVIEARPCLSAWFAKTMLRPACVKVFGVPAY